MTYGNQACTWLRSQPTAADPDDALSQWTDPFEFENMAYKFAEETADSKVVPLEKPERHTVASIAWRDLCPELKIGTTSSTSPATDLLPRLAVHQVPLAVRR